MELNPESNNKKEFEKWLYEWEGKSSSTASSYKSAINTISSHYSQQTNKIVDLFTVNDINFINELVKDYDIGGKYQDIGEKGHGTVRCAIAAYSRFLKQKRMGHDLSLEKKDIRKINKSQDNKYIAPDLKQELTPNKKHEILNNAFDFMLPVLPKFIGDTLQKKDENDWWQHYVLNKLPPNTVWDLPRNGTFDEYINRLDISLCIKIIIENWKEIFKYIIRNIRLSWVHELIEIRNDIAHWTNEKATIYTFEYISHTLSTIIHVMRSIETNAAEQISKIKREFENKYKDE